MSGWVKLHRKILENDIWSDVTAFRLFTLLLLKASHKDGIKIRGIEINRGQYLRSYSKLSEDLEYKDGRSHKKVSKSTIERKVNKLIGNGMVSVSETDSGTLFTITKYDEYQGFEGDGGTDSGTDSGTIAGRPWDDPGTTLGREQELKNLRTKELKELKPITDNMIDAGLSEVTKFYESNFGMIPAKLFQVIPDDYDRFGKELMLEAMQRAVMANVTNYAYVLSILKNWEKKNVKSLNDVAALDVEFENKKSQTSYGQKSQSVKKEPEWLHQQKLERAGKIVVENQVSPEMEERKRKLLKDLGINE